MILEKVVGLVTGGASGLGRATAQRLIQQGARVVIVDLPNSGGEAIADELGANCTFAPAHVESETEVKKAVDVAHEKYGCLNVSVNCAGINVTESTLSAFGSPHPLDLFEKAIKINAVGTFNVARLSSESMATNEPNEGGERGVIINVSSIHGVEGQAGKVAYAATKGAINGMTLPLARDLASRGIRVNAIAPGIFETPMFVNGRTEESQKAITQAVPFPKRPGYPGEFAHLVTSIIENPMINGEIIRIDGGIRLLHGSQLQTQTLRGRS